MVNRKNMVNTVLIEIQNAGGISAHQEPATICDSCNITLSTERCRLLVAVRSDYTTQHCLENSQ